MKKIYPLTLRTETEADFILACSNAGILNEDGEVVENASEYQMVRLGMLHRRSSEMENQMVDGELFDVPKYQNVPGYHVNVLSTDPHFLSEIQIDVDNPIVQWSSNYASATN